MLYYNPSWYSYLKLSLPKNPSVRARAWRKGGVGGMGGGGGGGAPPPRPGGDRVVAPPPVRILGGQNTKEKRPFLFKRNWSRANPRSKEHFSLVSAESARRWRGVLIRGGSPQNGF